MSEFYDKLLNELDVPVNHANIKKVINSFLQENHRLNVREVFKELLNSYSVNAGYVMSKEQTMQAIGVSRKTLEGMVRNGTSPSYFRTGTGIKSPYRFHMVDVAEFLAG